MKEYKILSMDKAVIRKNSIRTEHLCNQLLSKPGTKLRLEAIQNVTMLHRAEKVAARVFAEHSRRFCADVARGRGRVGPRAAICRTITHVLAKSSISVASNQTRRPIEARTSAI